MPSIKDLKKRIGTVRNTQQTTRAMKMVSAAKLRRAQDAIVANRPYAAQLRGLLAKVAQEPGVSVEHPLLKRETAEAEAREKKRVLLLVVSSDRGLCGGFNGNIFRGTQRWVRQNRETMDVTLAFVGRKGLEYFRGKKDVPMGPYFSEVTGKVSFAHARKLSEALIQEFTAGAFEEIHVIYNEFKNAVSQKVVVDQFLPLDLGPSSSGGAETAGLLIVKPTSQEVFTRLVEKSFSGHLFRVLLDSQASEHGARMSAMENATKNAGEMIRKLTLQYNKQRQAGITKELLEIISGSESQKAQ